MGERSGGGRGCFTPRTSAEVRARISPPSQPPPPRVKSQKRLVSPDLIRVISKPFEAGRMAASCGKVRRAKSSERSAWGQKGGEEPCRAQGVTWGGGPQSSLSRLWKGGEGRREPIPGGPSPTLRHPRSRQQQPWAQGLHFGCAVTWEGWEQTGSPPPADTAHTPGSDGCGKRQSYSAGFWCPVGLSQPGTAAVPPVGREKGGTRSDGGRATNHSGLFYAHEVLSFKRATVINRQNA